MRDPHPAVFVFGAFALLVLAMLTAGIVAEINQTQRVQAACSGDLPEQGRSVACLAAVQGRRP